MNRFTMLIYLLKRCLIFALFLIIYSSCSSKQTPPPLADQPPPELQFDLAELFLSSSAYEAATPIVRQLIHVHPDDPRPHHYLGVILRERGVYREAERSFLEALKKDPSFAPAHDGMGILYGVQSKLEEAVKAHRRATQSAPNHPKYWHNLGFALTLVKQFDEAASAYETSLKLAPNQPRTFINLALTRGAQGRDEEALLLLKQTLSPADAWYNLALIQQRRGDLKTAQESFGQALKVQPHHAKSKSALAHLKAQRETSVSGKVPHVKEVSQIEAVSDRETQGEVPKTGK